MVLEPLSPPLEDVHWCQSNQRSRQLPQTLNEYPDLECPLMMAALQNNLSRVKTASGETTFVWFFLFCFNGKRLNLLLFVCKNTQSCRHNKMLQEEFSVV